MREYELRIGELHRKSHLCDDCAVTVMSVVMAALKPKASEPRRGVILDAEEKS